LNMNGIFRRKTAITLIEVLIATLLVMVIFGAGIAATITMAQFLQVESEESLATENLGNAFEWIRKDAMQAYEADIGVANEITFTIKDYTADPWTETSVRYFVASDTTQLYREENGGAGFMITDMIDADVLPVFDAPEDNYLTVGIWIKDPETGALSCHWAGIMMRCSVTNRGV
jgi:type II secretory pathway pseudopilin PulG